MVPVHGGGQKSIIASGGYVEDIQLTPDDKTLVYSEMTGSRPIELYAVQGGGSPVALTHLNDSLLADYHLPPPEEFWVENAGGRVHSFVVKPPGFRGGHKYPVLYLIHGGPQGAWGQSWSYRWNQQVFAAAGFVVVMPNLRGSTGYGQTFIDEINGDWGGRAFDDLMAVADYVDKQPWADPDKTAAAGASYGGYMIDWILGHTQRFKALVSHAGVFDLRSMFGATEELWFPLWEFQGAPWDNPEQYAKWSPSYYAKDFHTPTLVIHGELDFRVPYTQGLQLFTAVQLQKIPSKLLVFPDEGHWVTKPLNSVLWYNTVLDWVKEWVNKAPAPATTTPAPAAAPAQPQPGVVRLPAVP
jgi:dipeptidyl aminopeptidase/acylaminoacyl peptidase